jgi:3-oxoacyl-[acyl-carrier-protein] synthase-1
VHIVAFGASTPIGRTVWTSAAAVRAGLCGFSEHPFMVDTAGEPMRIARAPWLGVSLESVERYCGLLFPAVDEALTGMQKRLEGKRWRLGLTLALPPVRPGRPAALRERLVGAISARYTSVFAGVVVFETGHAAGYAALDAAVRGLGSSIDACVVAGVDSYISPETLEWIETCDQLHGAGPLNNAWGFIPGEAASAALLGTETFAEEIGAECCGDVVSVGLGRETKLIKTDAVCVGEGLTQAFRAALAGLLPHEQIHNVFCDLNGEAYRADEYGFTALRTKERFRAATDFVAPADCWGDVGSAGAMLHAALGVIAHRKRYGKGPLSLLSASSETGERGAAVIRALDLEGD